MTNYEMYLNLFCRMDDDVALTDDLIEILVDVFDTDGKTGKREILQEAQRRGAKWNTPRQGVCFPDGIFFHFFEPVEMC